MDAMKRLLEDSLAKHARCQQVCAEWADLRKTCAAHFEQHAALKHRADHLEDLVDKLAGKHDQFDQDIRSYSKQSSALLERMLAAENIVDKLAGKHEQFDQSALLDRMVAAE